MQWSPFYSTARGGGDWRGARDGSLWLDDTVSRAVPPTPSPRCLTFNTLGDSAMRCAQPLLNNIPSTYAAVCSAFVDKGILNHRHASTDGVRRRLCRWKCNAEGEPLAPCQTLVSRPRVACPLVRILTAWSELAEPSLLPLRSSTGGRHPVRGAHSSAWRRRTPTHRAQEMGSRRIVANRCLSQRIGTSSCQRRQHSTTASQRSR